MYLGFTSFIWLKLRQVVEIMPHKRYRFNYFFYLFFFFTDLIIKKVVGLSCSEKFFASKTSTVSQEDHFVIWKLMLPMLSLMITFQMFILQKKNIQSQYCSCWWPGNTRSLDISSHDIELVCMEYFIAYVGRIKIGTSGLSKKKKEVLDFLYFTEKLSYLNIVVSYLIICISLLCFTNAVYFTSMG